MSVYFPLFCQSHYSFLQAASSPAELVESAANLDYQTIGIMDECSLAGIVKANMAAKHHGLKLIVGSYFKLNQQFSILVIAPTRQAYAELSDFISLARMRSEKGEYEAHYQDLRFRLKHALVIWLPEPKDALKRYEESVKHFLVQLEKDFRSRIWIGLNHQYRGIEQIYFNHLLKLSKGNRIPLVACPSILMHSKDRKKLLDTVVAIKANSSVQCMGTKLQLNAEAYLKSKEDVSHLYSKSLIDELEVINQQCVFSLDELRYQYPKELVPQGLTPIQYLRQLVYRGQQQRWPKGCSNDVSQLIEKELSLIEEMQYAYYFLTVYDIVDFARKKNILCQGRGSAANSVVCYCLYITEISPGKINVLFERFISKERDEPPDIDVDFEHERREEVIQYIYHKYGRQRAALAAAVVTYRPRSAIRDVGKALGLDSSLLTTISKSLAWWDRRGDLKKRINEAGLSHHEGILIHFFDLVHQILGFPRHLSQHVGGFVITEMKLSYLVPLENASMPERTIIQWDKDDLEYMGLMKVDVLALGMLTALRKALSYIHQYDSSIQHLSDIPSEDPATYDMLSQGDTVGVFQVESRAQMSMLPRLRPKCFYDLVIEIAIVRPGPIQGDMVHPYLRRRNGLEPIEYENDALEEVLKPTLGIPIFQEQAIRLAMVAAGFSGGEADHLRRAMASWGKNGNLLQFEEKFISGMLARGYSHDFAHRLFEQIKGFGGYGFPESHSASFALLCYASSWVKCHHPAAFYCAILNSQPMGFYSPSQLVQDAQRHHIKVLPIDINFSQYAHSVIDLNDSQTRTNNKGSHELKGIRLGFCLIKGIQKNAIDILMNERHEKGFYHSIQELYHRTQLDKKDMELLASADAFKSIAGHRYESRWHTAAVENVPRLFTSSAESHQGSIENSSLISQEALLVPAPLQTEEVLSDYRTTGLTLRDHPMTLLRSDQMISRCSSFAQMQTLTHGRFVRVAGIVTGRQRPGTAKGTLFLTLEDETGNINVIVWKSTQEQFRQELLTGKLLIVKGRLEKADNVTHVIAGHIYDYSRSLKGLNPSSRDFH